MTSIKAYLYDRAVSPLLGSLLISWIGWNYKFLILLLSELKYPDKIRYIHILYDTFYEVYMQGMLLPVLTSVIYLFVFTYPSEWVYRFSLSRQKILNDLKNEKQENELLTIEQSRSIRNQLAQTEKELDEHIARKDRAIEQRDKEIEQRDKEIEQLKLQLDDITNQKVDNSDKQSTEVQNETTKPERKNNLEDFITYLINVGSNSSPDTEEEYFAYILLNLYNLGSSTGIDLIKNLPKRAKAKYYLDELERRKLIENYHGTYSLTHEVKGVFVKHL